MNATTMELLEATGAHLREFELPAPWSVNINTWSGRAPVEIHLEHRDPSALSAALLAWADTLTAVTAEAWRVPDGTTVHLSITGHLSSGASLRVYGGMPFTQRGPGADLAPGATTTLPLATLRHLAAPGLVTEEVTL